MTDIYCETQISNDTPNIATGIRGDKWCFVRYFPRSCMVTMTGVIVVTETRVRCCRPKKVKIKNA